jgi:hypothetical protein
MITLYLQYTIAANKLDDFAAYASAEQIPIRESGGQIVGYFLPTDFAGATNQAHGLIDFASLAEYEIYRAKLAEHPLHKRNLAELQKSGCLLATQRSLLRRSEPPKDFRQ